MNKLFIHHVEIMPMVTRGNEVVPSHDNCAEMRGKNSNGVFLNIFVTTES